MRRLPRMRIFRPPGSVVFHADYRIDGKRFRPSLQTIAGELGVSADCSLEEHALAVLDLYRAEMQKAGEGAVELELVAGPPTVAQILKCYTSGLKAETKHRLEQERRAKVVSGWFGEGTLAEELTRERVAEYRDARVAEGKSWATVHGELSVLRWGCAAAVDAGTLNRIPYKLALERPKPARTRLIPARDLGRVLSWLDMERGVDRCILLLAYSGRRLHEVVPMDWADLDLECGLGTFGILKKRGEEPERVTYPLHPEVSRRLGPVALQGGPFTGLDDAYSWITKRTMQLCGTGYSAHCYRHTFATRLRECGVDKASIRELLSHGAEDVTDGYLHAANEYLRTPLSRLVYPVPITPPSRTFTQPLDIASGHSTKRKRKPGKVQRQKGRLIRNQ